jgi:hypothetical protein
MIQILQPAFWGLAQFRFLQREGKYRFEKKLSNRYSFSDASFFKHHHTSKLNMQLNCGTGFE